MARAISCRNSKVGIMEEFGYMPDGTLIRRLSLRANGLSAHVITYGAVLQDLRLDGHQPPLVLGFETFENYPKYSAYFGATAGRCANRIRDGRFSIDGTRFQVDQNLPGGHHLHGGAVSIGKRVWKVDDHNDNSATLSIDLADGEMGYPGGMHITAEFRLLPGAVLDIRYHAVTDKPTICNLAHHSYFNLDGSGLILDHDLMVNAKQYLPVDDTQIPAGNPVATAGSEFDFMTPKTVGVKGAGRGLDHNFCLSDQRVALRPVGVLSSRNSGLSMQINSTEPGLQVYDGAKIDAPVPGLDGMNLCAHSGIALEPQVWPDAVNNSSFPQPVLRPGENYRQQTQFQFGWV